MALVKVLHNDYESFVSDVRRYAYENETLRLVVRVGISSHISGSGGTPLFIKRYIHITALVERKGISELHEYREVLGMFYETETDKAKKAKEKYENWVKKIEEDLGKLVVDGKIELHRDNFFYAEGEL